METEHNPCAALWSAVLLTYWRDAYKYHNYTHGGTRPDLQPHTANATAECEAWADLMSEAAPLLGHVCAHLDYPRDRTRAHFLALLGVANGVTISDNIRALATKPLRS